MASLQSQLTKQVERSLKAELAADVLRGQLPGEHKKVMGLVTVSMAMQVCTFLLIIWCCRSAVRLVGACSGLLWMCWLVTLLACCTPRPVS